MPLFHSIRASMFLLMPLMATVSGAFKEIELTQENFDAMTADKTVFIKMYAPWCGHCKELAPDWERMAREWAHHKQALVASVDCTKEEEWCVSMGITGFPTLLFGDPSEGGVFLETFSGDKTYEGLSQFANETLTKPICSPGNPSLCDKPQREKIKSMWKMSISDLDSSIQEKEQSIEQAEKDFQLSFETMQAAYDKHSQDHELRKVQLKNNIKLLKTLLKKESS